MDQDIKIECSYDSLVALKDLIAHPKNRNKHSKEQIERIAELIKYQGIRKPITVSNLSGYITAGHGRLAAAKLLGIEKYPVDYQDYENREQEYADVQADNAIAAWAELDLEAIKIDVAEFDDFNPDMLGIQNFDGWNSDIDVNKHGSKNVLRGAFLGIRSTKKTQNDSR